MLLLWVLFIILSLLLSIIVIFSNIPYYCCVAAVVLALLAVVVFFAVVVVLLVVVGCCRCWLLFVVVAGAAAVVVNCFCLNGARERKIVHRVLSWSVNMFQYAQMMCSVPLSLHHLFYTSCISICWTLTWEIHTNVRHYIWIEEFAGLETNWTMRPQAFCLTHRASPSSKIVA